MPLVARVECYGKWNAAGCKQTQVVLRHYRHRCLERHLYLNRHRCLGRRRIQCHQVNYSTRFLQLLRHHHHQVNHSIISICLSSPLDSVTAVLTNYSYKTPSLQLVVFNNSRIKKHRSILVRPCSIHSETCKLCLGMQQQSPIVIAP